MDESFPITARSALDAMSEVASLRAAICDANGVMRGKRLQKAQACKALGGEMRMPLSLVMQDIWGRDVADNPMVQGGDSDGIARPTGRGPLRMDWLSPPSALLPMWMFHDDGAPCMFDPRQVLAAVSRRYQSLGLTPVVAIELEFHLVDRSGNALRPPVSPLTGERLAADGVLSLDDVDQFEGFFADVYAACEASDIAAEAASAEGGPGQFEINLTHVDDPLRAADDAVLFKRVVHGMARKHGLTASFMAKPFLDKAGNGLHVHFSLLDQAGRNVFDDDTPAGSDVMRNAVGGVMAAMQPSTLIFAPHRNSYRRLEAGSHAPVQCCWGYENRFTAVRIPGGPGHARRIEHRVAGAEANPYLVLSAILGAALDGIEGKITPPDPIEGDAYAMDLPLLPGSWESAILAFEETSHLDTTFARAFSTLFAACKRQELATFAARMTEFEVNTYLDVV